MAGVQREEKRGIFGHTRMDRTSCHPRAHKNTPSPSALKACHIPTPSHPNATLVAFLSTSITCQCSFTELSSTPEHSFYFFLMFISCGAALFNAKNIHYGEIVIKQYNCEQKSYILNKTTSFCVHYK